MANIQLAFYIIFPIFFTMALGFFAKNRGYLDEAFIKQSTWLVFYIALPLKLFSDIYTARIVGVDLSYAAYIVLGTCFVFFATWFFARLFIRDTRKLSAFVHCSFRSNFVYVGYPIIEAMLPSPKAEILMIPLTFGLTLYNILAIVILSYYGDRRGVDATSVVKGVIKNPMILAILAGMLFQVFNLPVYRGIKDGIALVGKLATPLSLILIGASLNLHGLQRDLPLVLSASAVKTMLVPLILTPIAYFLGFSREAILIAYVFWATPCAVNCFIFTKEMKGDADLASGIITASFLFSLATYPIGIAMVY